MAIKMPTSAGKTTLIELVSADSLDVDGESVAVVLAPTKALLRQLSSDLRKALPNDVRVRSSHGGLDFDIGARAPGGYLTRPASSLSIWSGSISNGARQSLTPMMLRLIKYVFLSSMRRT